MSYRFREGSLLVGSSAAAGLALNMSMEKLAEGLIAVRHRCKKNIFRMCEAVHSVAVDQIPVDDDLCQAASGRLLVGKETLSYVIGSFKILVFLCILCSLVSGLSRYRPLFKLTKSKKTTFASRADL